MTQNIFYAEDRFRSPLVLPEDFWEARPALAHIRDAARRRQAPPDLTFGAVLARVGVMADPRLRIPPRKGSPAPLGLYVCGVASSSGGKSTAVSTARELVPGDDAGHCVLDVVPASGEALLEYLWSDEEDEDGKAMRVRSKSSVLMSVDEGLLLKKLDGRTGNTLMAFLLSAWMGEAVGTDTLATAGKRGVKRRWERGTYVASMIVALQPRKAAELVTEEDAGFAQRFLWLAGYDDHGLQEEPEDHRVVPLELGFPRVGLDREIDGHPGLLEVRRPEGVSAEIWADGYARQHPDWDGDPLSGKDMLNRLRVAHCLALLDERLDIDESDWFLAGTVVRVSAAQRAAQVAVHQQLRNGEAAARVHEAEVTTIAVEEAREGLVKLKCRKAVVRMLREAGGRRQLDRGDVTKTHRPYLFEVLEEMVGDGVLGHSGSEYYLQ